MFSVQGSGEQSFDWRECGFSLHVPEGALLGTETCAVAVKALVAGNFKLPENTQLISGLYAISAAREFRKPVQTTIQHCLNVERKDQISRMYFIKAHQTHKGQPYIFQLEKGGDFEVGSQYCSFWQCSFSNLGVVLENQLHPVPVEDEEEEEEGSGSEQNEEAIADELEEEEEEERGDEGEERVDPIETASTGSNDDDQSCSGEEPAVQERRDSAINKVSVVPDIQPLSESREDGTVSEEATVSVVTTEAVVQSQTPTGPVNEDIPNDLLSHEITGGGVTGRGTDEKRGV